MSAQDRNVTVAQSRDDTPGGGGDDEHNGITTKRWARANDIRN
jgi:hypothetical protein